VLKLMTANWLLSLAALAAVSNVGGLPALGQSGKGHQDTILFGAADYEEYSPYDRLDEDVRMMKATGITVVRIAESRCGIMRSPLSCRLRTMERRAVVRGELPHSA
jgi:hypothetical protein